MLLVLEARRRTASVRLEGEGVQVRLTFCLGKVVTARYGRLRGRDALLQVLQMGRAALLVSRSFEPEEAELDASIRAVLAQQGEDTKRWARPAGEDLRWSRRRCGASAELVPLASRQASKCVLGMFNGLPPPGMPERPRQPTRTSSR